MVAAMPRFKQRRPPRAPHGLQQREVLHVARADLHELGVLGHELDVCLGEGLGDHHHPVVARGARERTRAQGAPCP
jgi:hypothetical protein